MAARAPGRIPTLVGAVLVGLAAGLAGFLGAGSTDAMAQAAAPPPPPVTVAKPVVKDITENDEFTGRFEAVDSVEIRSRVTGYLDTVHFQDGAIVKQGDLLFTIDPRPYQAAYDRAKSQVEVSQSRFEFAQNDLERAENLRKSGNIADQVLDQRRQNFISAQAELAGNKAALESARLDLEFTQIKAPLPGRISRRLVSPGNLVNANQTLLTSIVSLDPIQFYFDIDERSFVAYQKVSGPQGPSEALGTDVLISITGERDPTRQGKLDFLDNRLDAQTGTLRARAMVPNPNMFLTPGMFGRIRISGSAPYKGVLIPDEAIGSDQDRRIVYVVGDDGVAQPRVVRPGPKIDGYRVIRDGLKGDESVVVNGIVRVRPGTKVTPNLVTLPPVRERNGA
jgi:RND family efflux transporter MFP subunit